MGLAERRAIKQFQDKQFIGLQKQIHEAAGFSVPIEVSWDQIAEEGRGDHYAEWWSDVFFKPIIQGLGMIGRDAMGKEALKAGLKKIELRNTKETANPSTAITFENGTLTIDHMLANVGDVDDRTKVVVDLMEKGL